MIHTLFCDILYDELTAFVQTLHSRSIKTIIVNKGTITFLVLTLTEVFLFYNKLYPVPAHWITNMNNNCKGMPIEDKDA